LRKHTLQKVWAVISRSLNKQSLSNGGGAAPSLVNGQSYPKVEFHVLVMSSGGWRKECLAWIFSVRRGLTERWLSVSLVNLRIIQRTACVLFAVKILMVKVRLVRQI